jgi:hypothetical protein
VLDVMKISATNVLRAQKRFNNASKKYREVQSQIQQEIRTSRKAALNAEVNFFGKVVQEIGFTVKDQVILIGGLVDLKQKLDGGKLGVDADRYIKIYNGWKKEHLIVASDEDGSDEEKGDAEDTEE